jgi:hypothetical protein
MRQPFSEKLNEIDILIRAGQHVRAKAVFQGVWFERGRLPRAAVLIAASLARRLSLPAAGLALLHQHVRPSENSARFTSAASSQERAEYAACLIRIGAVDEALNLLDEISVEESPSSLIYRAFALTSRWEYEAVRVVVERFLSLRTSHPDPYQTLIARANLAQALAYLGDLTALSVIETALEEAKRERACFLMANLFILKAHVHVGERAWHEAASALSAAEERLAGSETIDAFLIRKQRAIIELHRSQGAKTAELQAISQEAQLRRHWESVRDCAYNLAIATHSVRLARHVYFGTPYRYFHERIARHFPGLETDQPYRLPLEGGGTSQSPTKTLDISLSAAAFGQHGMKFGQVPHRLLRILSEDFYRPKRSMEIFARLFPGEHYSPEYSSDRFHQACRRLRQQLAAKKIPLMIQKSAGFYDLTARPRRNIFLIFPPPTSLASEDLKSRGPEAKAEALLAEFHRRHQRAVFTAREFASRMNISGRSARRHLALGANAGVLEVHRQGPETTYRLKMTSY